MANEMISKWENDTVLVFYRSNKEIARWTFENDLQENVVKYEGEKINGIVKRYKGNGSLRAKENYVDNIENGISTTYYESGVLESEQSYKDGLQDGPSVWYDENGKVVDTQWYLNGVLDKEPRQVVKKHNNVVDERTKVTKTCPFCSEQIQVSAIKCRYCGEFLYEKTDKDFSKERNSFDNDNSLNISKTVNHNTNKSEWPLVFTVLLFLGLVFFVFTKYFHKVQPNENYQNEQENTQDQQRIQERQSVLAEAAQRITRYLRATTGFSYTYRISGSTLIISGTGLGPNVLSACLTQEKMKLQIGQINVYTTWKQAGGTDITISN